MDVFRDELPRKHSPRLKFEGIDESLWRSLTHHGKNSPGPDIVRMDRLMALSLTGAWLLFVGGVIGLVNSVNGRDHCLLNNVKYVSFLRTSFRDVLCRTQGSFKQQEVCGSIKKSNITNMITLGDRRTYFSMLFVKSRTTSGPCPRPAKTFHCAVVRGVGWAQNTKFVKKIDEVEFVWE